MPNIDSLTQIPASRVPLIDERTGLISREWYFFFTMLFNASSIGNNGASIQDVQLSIPNVDALLGELGIVYSQAQLASMMSQAEQADPELRQYVYTQPRNELGTMSPRNFVGASTPGGIVYDVNSSDFAATTAGSSGQYLTSTGGSTPTWSSVASNVGQPAYWGSFWDLSATQTAPSTTVANAVLLGQADPDNNGVVIASSNRITVAHAGVYNIQYSLQFTNADSQIFNANVWLRKNGSDVADSNSVYAITSKHGSTNGQVIAAINYVLKLAAGDYLQIMWQPENTMVYLESVPAGTTPTTPVSPCAIVTVSGLPQIGLGYAGLTSTTSTTIGTGSKTFTTNLNSDNTAYTVGTRVRVAYSVTPSNFMEGIITAFSGTSLTVNVDAIGGSGTYAAWNFSVAGDVGSLATNLAGGAAGSVPYQSAPSTTTFLSIGANNYVMTSNGSAPIWTANTGTGSVVRATSPTLTTPIVSGAAVQQVFFAGLGGTISYSNNFRWDTTSYLTYDAMVLRSTSRSGSGVGSALVLDTDTTGTVNYISSSLNNGNSISDLVYTAGTHIFRYGATEVVRFLTSGAISFGSTGTNYGSSGQILVSAGNASPAWTTAVYPTTTAAGTILTSATANTVTASATPTLGVQQTTRGSLTLANTAAGAFATTIQSSNSATAAWTLTLPTTAGTNTYVLQTDGSGNTSWVAQSGSGTVNTGTAGQLAYYATSTNAVSGATTGTGVLTALAVNTGTAGAFVVNGGALGTPSSGTLTNATGLPLSTGVTGTLGVGNGGTGLTSGTSGGVPYYSATNTLASSAALTANALMIGGGAGAAPSTTSTAAGILTFLGTPSSANLASAVTDETGSGPLVFATTPKFTSTIGVGNATAAASGAGVSFPATQSASSDANTLDDYEEGTFNPTIVGVTTAGTATYIVQIGQYTKIGDRVFFNLYLVWTGHTGTGNMVVGALPFTNNANGFSAVSIWSNNLALTAGNILTGYVQNSDTIVNLQQTPTGTTASVAVPIDTSASLMVAGHYRI